MQTSAIQVRPVNKSESEKLAGFEVVRTIGVEVKDLTQIEKLLSEALKNGATNIDSQQLQTTQMRKYRDKARSEAAKAAREKAELLANSLGVKVGRVRTIKEGHAQSAWPSNSSMNVLVPEDSYSSEGVSTTTFAAGKISIRSTVTVTFDLE